MRGQAGRDQEDKVKNMCTGVRDPVHFLIFLTVRINRVGSPVTFMISMSTSFFNLPMSQLG